jgi:hypothetical protein
MYFSSLLSIGDKKKAGSLEACHSAILALEPVLVGNGEFLAAVAAAGCEHPASVGRAHTLTEAMLVDALAYMGLVCSFHIV